LTHGGEALSLGGPGRDGDDDYNASDDDSLDSIDEERDKDQSSLGFGGLHMKRAPQAQQPGEQSAGDAQEEPASVDSMDIDSDMEDGGPKRKKSKAEIMAELVSKSKYFRVRFRI
jgi:cobalamin biosynthesis protein CobT